MMNNWGNEQYAMQMGQMSQMLPNMMQMQGMAPPLPPPPVPPFTDIGMMMPNSSSMPSSQNTMSSGQHPVSGQNTMPSGQNTMPSGQNTMPSGQNTMPSGQNTMPSGQIPMPKEIPSDNVNAEDMNISDEEKNTKSNSKERKEKDQRQNRERDRQDRDRRDRGRDYRDRGGRGSRDRNDRRNDDRRDIRGDSNKTGDGPKKRQRWDNEPKQNQAVVLANMGSGMIMPGMMPQYENMNTQNMPNNMMTQYENMNPQNMPNNMMNMPNMSMQNIPNMAMQNMVGMPQQNLSNIQSMPMQNMNNMNMQMQNMPMANMQDMSKSSMGNMQNMALQDMSNMMGGNNMMQQSLMNQQMMMYMQPKYYSNGVLLPPLPGTALPPKKEKPPGCRTIFIGGLPKDVSQSDIEEMFGEFGPISSMRLQHRQGVCHIRFQNHASVDQSFSISGYRLKKHDEHDNEATTIFVEYAINYDDKKEFERAGNRVKAPPRTEPFSMTSLSSVTEKLKSEEKFTEAAPSLLSWLERGECNKQTANMFYSLIQITNNQTRRLMTEKMSLDEELQNIRATIKEKYEPVIVQFEQIAKILTAAKHQRVSDYFSKVQRRNIEMWHKMTEELENIKEEFNTHFDDDEVERGSKNVVAAEKYEEIKAENENLISELELLKNEAHIAKQEADLKFERFKAQYVATQALQNPGDAKRAVVLPLSQDKKTVESDAKIISLISMLLTSHPLGASTAYIITYVKSMAKEIDDKDIITALNRYEHVFCSKEPSQNALTQKWTLYTFKNSKA